MNTLRLTAMCLRLGLAASLFLGAATVPGAPSAVSQEDLAAQKELTQAKMDALRDLQQKDAEAAKSRMDAIDKRLDDQISKMGQGVDRLGVYASILGILITTLLAGLGLLGYFTVVRRTKSEAQESAKQWFDDHATDLKNQIEQLVARVQEGHQIVDDKMAGFNERLDHAQQIFQAQMDDKTAVDPRDLQEAQAVAAIRVEQLRNTAEISYSFDDWNTKAHAAYAAKQLEKASLHWQKASQIPNAGSVRVAQALFNRGVTQGHLGQSEEEIKTYDEMLRRFGDATEAALKEQVAKALLNKGVAQRQLGQSKEAIKTYNEVLRRFGDATEAALKEQVAKALFNKGVAQGQLGQREEEIKTYDEVLRRFGDATEATLKELVATALNGLGFAYLTQAKAQWADQTAANALLRIALDRLKQAIPKRQPSSGIVLGNRAYVHGCWGTPLKQSRILLPLCVQTKTAVKRCMKAHSKTLPFTPFQKTKACARWSSANGWLGRQNMTKAMLLGQPSRRMADFY